MILNRSIDCIIYGMLVVLGQSKSEAAGIGLSWELETGITG